MILDEKPLNLLEQFLDDYNTLFPINKDKAREWIKTGSKFDQLTNLWYERLEAGDYKKAYSIYDHDHYFVDIFCCFSQYSRRYLRDLRKHHINGKSFVDMTKETESIIDLGCGLGYTTAALKQMYPDATVMGVNIPDTKQWQFCEATAKKYNFQMYRNYDEIMCLDVDIVFASEYFEHIINPFDQLRSICLYNNPHYFIIANAFNTRSIGHLTHYIVDKTVIDQSKMNRLFNNEMRNLGYERMKTNFFNNRPAIWKRIDD